MCSAVQGEVDMAGSWYYNTKTGQVRQGRGFFSWFHVMGPYDTADDARHALDRAQQRDSAWEEADEKWNEADHS